MPNADRHTWRTAYGRSRVSSQRRAIAEAVSSLGAAFTVERLAEAVRELDPSIGLATVYRAVGALESAGSVARVGERCGSALFTFCDHADHHHHLVCTGCGKVEHAPCPLDASALARAQQSGFTITAHEVNLFGVCTECAGIGAET